MKEKELKIREKLNTLAECVDFLWNSEVFNDDLKEELERYGEILGEILRYLDDKDNGIKMKKEKPKMERLNELMNCVDFLLNSKFFPDELKYELEYYRIVLGEILVCLEGRKEGENDKER